MGIAQMRLTFEWPTDKRINICKSISLKGVLNKYDQSNHEKLYCEIGKSYEQWANWIDVQYTWNLFISINKSKTSEINYLLPKSICANRLIGPRFQKYINNIATIGMMSDILISFLVIHWQLINSLIHYVI
jgi:hypothetical protein